MIAAAAADTLLAQLELVPYGERIRRMVALGQDARTNPDAADTLQALGQRGGFYERLLVLHACAGSGNGEQVLLSLSDPSRLLRNLAVKLAPTVCTDEQIAFALTQVPHKTRTLLLRGLLRKKRRNGIGAFLEALAATGDLRLGELLAFGPIEIVQQHLPALAPRFGVYDWARLARFHPDVASTTLVERVQALTEPNPRLLLHVNAVLPILAESRPDDALALVRALLRFEPPARLVLQRLAERKVAEVADLLLQAEDGTSANVDLSRVAHRLDGGRLAALLERRPTLLPRRHLFLRRLPFALRRAAYEAAGIGWRTKEGVLDAAVVALLPADLRQAEARRCFGLPALATRPTQRLAYATLLPWDEARQALEPFVRNPDADLRGVALSALVGVARYDRARLPDVLAFVSARKNEQDPVRSAMLAALAALPPTRWQAEHLEALGQIVQDALHAADLSPITASHAENLIVSLVPFHPTWAAPWLGKLVQSRGQIHFYNLGDRLTNADVERIAPALLPVLAAWETRERERFLVQAATSLGRRLRVFDALVAIWERVLATTRQSYVASQILSLLTMHRADRLPDLIPALLQSDVSVVTLPAVYNYLHRKRQDLLTPFLGQQAYGGRWSTGRTRFVMPIMDGFYRWTPTQQETFGQTLTQITNDEARDTPALFQAMNQLAALPAVFPARLIALADPRMERLAVRDTALRALARLDDSGQGISVLVEALGDVRARVAIYALRSALLEMPAPRALTLLQTVPTEKVTVAKEVVRLLGELDTPDVYPVLMEMEKKPLHRDVRVALLRALWDHVEQNETWPVLTRAASDADPTIASGVVRIPTDRKSPGTLQRLLHLLAILLTHPDVKVRMDTLARCADLPIADPARVLLPPLLLRLASPLPDECTAAARAVFATYAGNAQGDANAVGEAVTQIKGNRAVLLATLHALHTALTKNRSRLLPTVRAVLSALAGDRLTARHRAELAIAGLPWIEVADYMSRLAGDNELDAETLMASVRAIEGSVTPRFAPALRSLFVDSETWDEETTTVVLAETGLLRSQGEVNDTRPQGGIRTLEAKLSTSPDEKLRRLALAAVVAQANGSSGWTDALRTNVNVYRQDAAPLVASAAQFIVLPPEQDPQDTTRSGT